MRLSFWVVLLASLALAPVAGAAKTLAEGTPPLTDEMIGQYFEFYEWAFDTQLTVDQKKKLEDYLVQVWKAKNEKEIKEALDTLKNHDDLAKMSSDERDMIRTQVQPQLLTELRKDKAPISKWALEVYESAHKALVPSKPPLTRQVTDAYAELMVFLVNEAVGGTPYVADQPFRDGMAKGLTEEWKKMPADKRKALVGVPMLWAAVRGGWAAVPDADKAKYRKQWLEQIALYKPKAQAADAGVTEGAERWAQNILTARNVANLNVVNSMESGSWHYEPSHW